MERTHGDDDGFLWDPGNALAFILGYWKMRGCRLCGAPLEMEGTWIHTVLMCPYCDTHEWNDPATEITVGDFLDGE